MILVMVTLSSWSKWSASSSPRTNSLEKFGGNAWLDVTYSVAGRVKFGGWTCQVNTFMDIGG